MKQKRIHLWIGSNFFPKNEYLKYFEIDHSTDDDFIVLAIKYVVFAKILVKCGTTKVS